DNCTQRNQRRFISFLFSIGDRFIEGFGIFNVVAGLQPVDPLDMPAVSFITLLDIFVERNIGVIFNRDLVVVPNDNQVAKLLGTGKRRRFRSNTFLQITV